MRSDAFELAEWRRDEELIETQLHAARLDRDTAWIAKLEGQLSRTRAAIARLSAAPPEDDTNG